MSDNAQLPLWALYLQAFSGPFATVVAAGGAAWVTYLIQSRHLQATRDKLKFDLFPKRMEVYEATSEFVRRCLSGPPAPNEILARMQQAISDSRFLFGPDMFMKLQEIYDACCDYETAFKFSEVKPGSASEAHRAIHSRFSLYEIFAPYLSFSHVRA